MKTAASIAIEVKCGSLCRRGLTQGDVLARCELACAKTARASAERERP